MGSCAYVHIGVLFPIQIPEFTSLIPARTMMYTGYGNGCPGVPFEYPLSTPGVPLEYRGEYRGEYPGYGNGCT